MSEHIELRIRYRDQHNVAYSWVPSKETHERLPASVQVLHSRYYPAGSPEAEAFLAERRVIEERERAEAEEQERRRVKELRERAEASKAAIKLTPKTGPQPWPEGTEFVYIVTRYKSGILRAQRLPLCQVKARFKIFPRLAEAQESALTEVANEASRTQHIALRAANLLHYMEQDCMKQRRRLREKEHKK
jgi:hypothetical protein